MLFFLQLTLLTANPVRLFKGDFSTAHQVAGDAVVNCIRHF